MASKWGTNPNRMKLKVTKEAFGMVKSKTQTPQVDGNKRKY